MSAFWYVVLFICAAMLFVLFPLPVLAGRIVCFLTFGHKVNQKPRKSGPCSSDFPDLAEEPFSFFSGGHRLLGHRYTSKCDCEYEGILFVVPGYGYLHQDYLAEIDYFVKRQYVVFSYEGTGCGSSEGKSLGGYPQFVLDLYAAILHVLVRDEHRELPVYLFGHSIGAYAATAVLNFGLSQIKGVIACSPVNSGTEYAGMVVKACSCAVTRRFYRTFQNYEKKRFGRAAEFSGISGVNHSEIPIVIAHSRDDRMVPLICSVYQYKEEAVNPNVRFYLYGDRGHFVFKAKRAGDYLNAGKKEFDPCIYALNTEFLDMALEELEKINVQTGKK